MARQKLTKDLVRGLPTSNLILMLIEDGTKDLDLKLLQALGDTKLLLEAEISKHNKTLCAEEIDRRIPLLFDPIKLLLESRPDDLPTATVPEEDKDKEDTIQ